MHHLSINTRRRTACHWTNITANTHAVQYAGCQKTTVNTNDISKRLFFTANLSALPHFYTLTICLIYWRQGCYCCVCSVILLDWQKYQRAENTFTHYTLMSLELAAACRRHCERANLQSWKKRRETILSTSKQGKYLDVWTSLRLG